MIPLVDSYTTGAIFGQERLPDGTAPYRYRLWRRVRPGRTKRRVGFLMLNPSTADEYVDDPTIRRCIGFARAWGFDVLEVVNLFAWRSTDPSALLQVEDPVGPDNGRAILDCAGVCEFLVAAWGARGGERGRTVRSMLAGTDLRVLRLTKHGDPAHPLYLPASLRPMPWVAP